MEFNLADLFEHAVDHFGDREYLVCEGKRRTYAEMEERANRLAHHLAGARRRPRRPRRHLRLQLGRVGRDPVGRVQAARRLGSTSTTATSRTSSRYLFDNADLKALVYQREFAPRVAGVLRRPAAAAAHDRDRGRQRRRLIGLDAVAYEDGDGERARPSATSAPAPPTTATSSTPAAPPACPRASCGATRTSSSRSAAASTSSADSASSGPSRWSEKGLAAPGPTVDLPIAPLMHGATQWAVMGGSFVGNKVVLMAKFDPDRVLAPRRRGEGQPDHDHGRRDGAAR